MEFKVGDHVIVSNPVNTFRGYGGKTGVIYRIPGNIYKYYHIKFDDRTAPDCFTPDELQLAKNHIVINILKDL